MPATRKISNTVQNQDLNQLKNLFSSKKNITSEFIETPEFDTKTETKNTAVKEDLSKQEKNDEIQDLNIITEEKKEVSDTTVGIRMTTAKKREMKSYFIQHGTTLSQGVIDAFTLLRKLEANGIVEYNDGLLEINNA